MKITCRILLNFLIIISINSCTPTVELTPILTTSEASAITQTSASSGGNITVGGGSTISARGVCWSTSANPTIEGNKTSDGAGIGTFTSSITGLLANTVYYVRAYATNAKSTVYGNNISFTTPKLITFNPSLTYGSVTDIDGNVYKTIVIGSQTWMAENLRTSKFQNGNTIPIVTDDTNWSNLTTGACCVYNNDVEYLPKYGKLYNWYAVSDSRNISPTGWHVPTDADWITLITYLSGESIAGGKLKETGTGNWISPNIGATNESGFSGLPGGTRRLNVNYMFDFVGAYGIWWSASESSSNGARSMYLACMEIKVYRFIYPKSNGLTVRCVKDTQ